MDKFVAASIKGAPKILGGIAMFFAMFFFMDNLLRCELYHSLCAFGDVVKLFVLGALWACFVIFFAVVISAKAFC